MPYSQKYCLVAFADTVEVGTVFAMSDCPLHITLADVFSIEDRAVAEKQLINLLRLQYPVCTTATKQATLGITDVVLLEQTMELLQLHEHILNVLLVNGAQFNNPEFTGTGFLPHCTIQKTGKLQANEQITIRAISLVDMFPDGDWQLRKVLRTFRLRA